MTQPIPPSISSTLRALALVSPILLMGCVREERCDWKDNDRDGLIDEGFDADGDGWWACGLTEQLHDQGLFDCDDAEPAVNPDALETCNGLDDDCTGVIDEGCGEIVGWLTGEVTGLTAMDLNGDDILDLVAVVRVMRASSPDHSVINLAWRSENGSFTFGEASAGIDNEIFSVASMDANGDERADLLGLLDFGLASLVQLESGQTEIVLNDFLLPFEADIMGCDIVKTGTLLLQDTDGDGLPEQATVGVAPWGSQKFLISDDLNFVRGAWQVTDSFEWSNLLPFIDLYRTDLDANGTRDLVMIGGGQVSWRYGSEAGYSPEHALLLDDDIGDTALGDLDGDGNLDLLVSLPDRWRLYRMSTSGGTFSDVLEEVETPFRFPNRLTLIDGDNDGDLDVMVTSRGEAQVAILANDGRGGLTLRCVEAVVSEPLSVLALPGQGSGAPPLIVLGHEGGEITVLRGLCQ